jgi:hypothetical protein
MELANSGLNVKAVEVGIQYEEVVRVGSSKSSGVEN